MNKIYFWVLALIAVVFDRYAASSQVIIESQTQMEGRTFRIDYDKNTFLMNGEPFRFIAGSFHYFRALPETWRRKLRAMRAAGLNAVTTYVEWSLHNPKEGVYVWEGIADLVRFVEIAAEEDLYVIFRPGPYICAERDMGGFPYWLLRKYPKIKLRTIDIDYVYEVRVWYQQLMPRIVPYLYENGGPIIMVQVENEYGSFSACDRQYSEWLRDETSEYVQNKAVLFTNDGPGMLRCGHIDGVLPTLDFGAGTNVKDAWGRLRQFLPKGPLVNSEYYPGWLTHWQEPMQRVQTEPILKTFIEMLDDGASVNFYMFYGGTNFGFTAGANDGGPGRYNADLTSYDYDAPLDESGDPTQKYLDIRDVIGRYLPLPNISIPIPLPKRSYGTVKLIPCCSILSSDGRNYLSDGETFSERPVTFEYLDQFSGLVLYETDLPILTKDPTILKINAVNDRAYVYVDRNFIGIMSRESQVNSLPINAGTGNRLQILVENQGRINYNIPNDFKGILSEVMLGSKVLKNFNITKYSLESFKKIERLIETQFEKNRMSRITSNKALLRTGPGLFYGELLIENEDETFDTYLDSTNWGKGVVFINGFNLGRYWPVVGPQITIYVPKELLKVGSNRIVFIEYQNAPESGEIEFTDVPNLDGYLYSSR